MMIHKSQSKAQTEAVQLLGENVGSTLLLTRKTESFQRLACRAGGTKTVIPRLSSNRVNMSRSKR